MPIIVPGSNSLALAKSISDITGFGFAQVSARKFPDGESYVRIDSKLSADAIIVQSAFPSQNDSLIELALLADAAKDAGAKTLKAVMPYFPYSRQDKKFQCGEALSIRAVASILKCAGIGEIITIDAHFHRKPERFDFYGISATNVSAGRILLDFARKTIPDFSVIVPDFGSSDIIEFAGGGKTLKKEKICPGCGSNSLLCKCGGSEKTYEAKISGDTDFAGKNVVILDDMIASGTTMIKAIEKLRGSGAAKVGAVASHGLFLKDSLKTLQEKTDLLAVTDSIRTPVSKVSVAGIVAEALAKA
ncbi:MAG: ribose-phosphate diphosphokinase [Candidatus Aenigmatarchaeota archaeon]